MEGGRGGRGVWLTDENWVAFSLVYILWTKLLHHPYIGAYGSVHFFLGYSER